VVVGVGVPGISSRKRRRFGTKFIIVATLVYSFMSKETLIFLCGILLTIIPFLGIPEDWRQYAILGVGIFLIIMGYALRRAVYLHRIDYGNGERGSDAFIETTSTLFEQNEVK